MPSVLLSASGCVLTIFFSGRRRHTIWTGHWSSDVCSSDLRCHLRLRNLAHFEPERDVLGHRHVWKQRIALEHEAGVALPWWERGDVAFAQMHAAAARLHERSEERRVGKECRARAT